MKYIKLDSKKNGYYFSLFLTIYCAVMLAIPPYSWRSMLGLGAFLVLLIEVTRYRYFDYRPEKNPLFNQMVGEATKMIIDAQRIVVHHNGKDVKRYAVSLTEIKENDDGSTEDSSTNKK